MLKLTIITLVVLVSFTALKCNRDANEKATIENLSTRIEEDPNKAENYLLRATLYNQLGQDNRALSDLQRAIELDSTSITIRYSLAYAYFFVHDYTSAIREITKVIAIDSTVAEYYVLRASCNENMRLPQGAVRDWDKVIRIHPQLSSSYIARAKELRLLGRYREAIADYEKSVELYNQGKDSTMDLFGASKDMCEMLSTLGDQQGALRIVDDALSQFKSDSATFLYYRGILQYRIKKYQAAIEDLYKSIAGIENYGIPYYYLSTASAAMGKKEFARKYFELAIENGFDDMDIVENNSDFKNSGLLPELNQITRTHKRNHDAVEWRVALDKYIIRDTLLTKDIAQSLLYRRMHEICMEPDKQRVYRKLYQLRLEEIH